MRFARTYETGESTSWIWIPSRILVSAPYTAGYTKSEAEKSTSFSQLLSLPQGWFQVLPFLLKASKKPKPKLIFTAFPWGKTPTFLSFFFTYELLHNKVSVFHSQNYKPSPHFSGTTELKRLLQWIDKAVPLQCYTLAGRQHFSV